jgi:hypothetical protein
MLAAPVPNINVQCSVLQRLVKGCCIPELGNFKFCRLRLQRFFIRKLSGARFGYPEGGLDKRTEYKKWLTFLCVKLWRGSPAARWQGGEVVQLWDPDIVSSVVVDAVSKKIINITT